MRADDRAAGCQGLHHRDRLRLILAEQDEEPGPGEQGGHPLAVVGRQLPDLDPVRHPQLLGKPPQAWFVGAGADDPQAGVGALPDHRRKRRDHPVVSLVPLEAANGEDQRLPAGGRR